jgi:hypothetical protein
MEHASKAHQASLDAHQWSQNAAQKPRP